jgi:hypothetical protein
MKKHTCVLWLQIFIITTTIFSGCNKTDNANDSLDFPDIGIPAKNLNSHLKINSPSEISLLQGEKCFFVIVENIANSTITIEPDLDVKIFRKTNSGWESIQNGMSYTKLKWPVPIKESNMPNIVPVDICPVLHDFQEPTLLRIVIIGTPENIFGIENTVSFMDITVTP